MVCVRRGRLALMLPLLALLTLAAGDVIFRVPEVLVRHAAAPKPVGTGRSNATRVNDSERWDNAAGAGGALLDVRYEEYFVEHDVSTADARIAAGRLNLDDTFCETVISRKEAADRLREERSLDPPPATGAAQAQLSAPHAALAEAAGHVTGD